MWQTDQKNEINEEVSTSGISNIKGGKNVRKGNRKSKRQGVAGRGTGKSPQKHKGDRILSDQVTL